MIMRLYEHFAKTNATRHRMPVSRITLASP
jgi:hypothetical protein